MHQKDIRNIKSQTGFKTWIFKVDPFANISVGTVQTVSRRLEKVTQPDLIIIDETHLAIANTYQSIVKYFLKLLLLD